MKELRVSAIENGTVIDHIPARYVSKVGKILGLDKFEDMILSGNNLESKKLGKKGVIKFSNRYLDIKEVNRISLYAPQATVVTIKNFEVISKHVVEIPDELLGIAKCPNEKCITNYEQVETRFFVHQTAEGNKLKCHYCEKTFDMNDVRIII